MFSKACEYGIRAVLHIARASHQGKRVGLKEIAKAVDSPEAFTAKILQTLVRGNIIQSTKGPNGGFDMSEVQRKDVKMIDVVTTIDGPGLFENCALGLKQCDAKKPCPLHDQFLPIRNDIIKLLTQSTVTNVAENLKDGQVFLKV